MLENASCGIEKNVYSAAVGWNALCISVKFISSNVLFKVNVFLMAYCVNDLFIDVSWALKSPNVIVLLSITLFHSVIICFMYLGALMFGA